MSASESQTPVPPASTLERLKTANSRLLALRWLLQDFSRPAMPEYVCFNVTPACNLKCPQCPIHGTAERKKTNNDPARSMSREHLAHMARQALPYARTFNLTLTGETLIIPDLDAILAELLPYGAKLEVTTNGTRMTARNIERLLPVAGLLQASCDGASPWVFEQLRLGARHRDFLRNMKLLGLTAGRVSDLYRPTLGLTCTAMASNLRELPGLVRLAAFLGLTELRVDRIVPEFPGQEDEDIDLHKGAYNYYIRTAWELGQKLGVSVFGLQGLFPGVADEREVRQLPRMIVKQPLSDSDYAGLPPFESLVDLPALEAEADRIAAAIRDHARQAPAAAEPEWWGQEAGRLEADFAWLAVANAERLRGLAADPQQAQGYCIHLHSRAFTRFDGRLMPCCNDTPANLGDLHRQPVAQAWNDRPRLRLIEQFMSEQPPGFCAHCAQRWRHPVGELLRLAFPEGLEAGLATLPPAPPEPPPAAGAGLLARAGRWLGLP